MSLLGAARCTLGGLLKFLDRWAERRAEKQREEDEFLDACRELVRRRIEPLEAAGLVRVEWDEGEPRGAPDSTRLIPANAAAPEVWIGFDYPTFCLELPHAGSEEPFEATAELFGTYPERLEELEERLDAIVSGRLEWKYTGSGCVHITWLDADGEQFLGTAYSGRSQGDEPASGRSAPYAG